MDFKIESIIELQDALKDVVDNAISLDLDSKKSLSLADKILLYVKSQKDGVTPSDIICEFSIKKSNLTAICNSLIEKGLLVKTKNNIDKRSITYVITEAGNKDVSKNLEKIEKKLSKILSKNECEKLFESINTIIDILK